MGKYIPVSYTVTIDGRRPTIVSHLARAREFANYWASKNHNTYAQILNEEGTLIETFYYDDAGSTHWKRSLDL